MLTLKFAALAKLCKLGAKDVHIVQDCFRQIENVFSILARYGSAGVMYSVIADYAQLLRPFQKTTFDEPYKFHVFKSFVESTFSTVVSAYAF